MFIGVATCARSSPVERARACEGGVVRFVLWAHLRRGPYVHPLHGTLAAAPNPLLLEEDVKPRTQIRSTFVVLAALLTTLVTVRAHSFNRHSKWSKPVVKAYTCPDKYATYFGAYPWATIRRQLLAAANEWFVTGGADLRVRVMGDLASTDARCTEGSGWPNDGEILVTAERNNGAGNCWLATTLSSNTNGDIRGAKVILHSGTVCNGGVYTPYTWATNAEFPQSGQYDFWTVFLHELGHAIGFDHSGDSNAVMWPTSTSGENVKRKLAVDDLSGLRDGAYAYGPIQTTMTHRYSNNAINWNSEGEPLTSAITGQPGVCWSNRSSSSFYFVAVNDAASRNFITLRTSGSSPVQQTVVPGWWSHFPPVLGCHENSAREIMLHVSGGSDMVIWSSSMPSGTGFGSVAPVNTGRVTQNVPALAYANFKGWYVMAFTDRFNGKIRTMISRDDGLTWGWYQEFNNLRTFHPMGLTCQDSGGYCFLTYSDGNYSHTPMHAVALSFDANGYLYVTSNTDTGYNSYGGGVASDPNRFQFMWRDRGTATVLTSGGWPWAPTLDNVNFTSVILHSPPTGVRNPSWGEYTAWSSFSTRYDQ